MENSLEQKPAGCKRIVLYGPESTGKTTMARALAAHYNAPWVPEFARDYLQGKWDREKKICEPHDLIPIAQGQMKLENEAASSSDSFIFCDTDLLTTKVYSESYYEGWCDPLLNEYALKNQYDLYLLLYIDTPWVDDDPRDRPHQREDMFEQFKGALEKYNRPYLLLRGDIDQRLSKAINHLNQFN